MNLKKTIIGASLALSSTFVQADTLTIDSASDWGGSHSSYPASKTIDGSLSWSSRWAAELDGDAVNLVLDLGSAQTIDDVGISWGRGSERTFNFEIWARKSSSDSWTKVRDRDDSSGDTSSIESYNVDDMSARYVRIKTHSNSAGTDWTDIKEVEIYGTGSSDSDPDDGGSDDGGSDNGSDGELTINTIFDDGTSHSSYPASNANDGSSAWSSRWAAEADGDAVNLTAQFDSSQTVTDVGVSWGRGDSRSHTFEIYARDATSGTWTKVYDGESSGDSTGIENYDVTDMVVQQVRLKVQSNSAGTDWANVTEMKLYGNSSNDGGGDDGGGNDDGGGDDDGGSGSDIPSNITDGSIFDLEGDDPHPLVNSSTLEFVALETKVTTPNGNGWRHEYKVEEDQRVAMTDTYEYFKATIKVDLSDGGKTIVAQHHAGDTGTIMKLYVADSSESDIGDSNPDDGVFGVYVRIRNTDGDEEKKSFGTIKSGDSFTFTVENNYGVVEVSAMGSSFETEVEDDSESYFKFGNYLQSQYPDGSEDCGESGDSDSFEECFDDIGITTAKITMTDVSYTRKVK